MSYTSKKEAEQKWCPFYQVAICDEELFDNRRLQTNHANFMNSKCITDECMAWLPWDDSTGRCGLVQ